MLCLELGEKLAALAAEHCRPYPAVEIRNTTFEDWPLRRQAFDLVISASAFHWIPPGPGYAKVAAALNDAGSIALFWNHSLGPDPHLSEVLEQVYRERAPELGEYVPGCRSTDALVKETVAEIDASGLLTAAEQAKADVLNGIAYDQESGRFVITGKLWPKAFEVELVPARAR